MIEIFEFTATRVNVDADQEALADFLAKNGSATLKEIASHFGPPSESVTVRKIRSTLGLDETGEIIHPPYVKKQVSTVKVGDLAKPNATRYKLRTRKRRLPEKWTITCLLLGMGLALGTWILAFISIIKQI